MRLELVTYVSFAFLNSYQGLEFVKQLNRILNNSVFCCTHVSSFKTFAGNIIYIAFNPIQVLFSFLQLFLSFLQRNSYDRYTYRHKFTATLNAGLSTFAEDYR